MVMICCFLVQDLEKERRFMKHFVSIIVFYSILLLTGCSSNAQFNEKDISNIDFDQEYILVSIKEGSLTDEGAIFEVENTSNKVLGYSEDYHLEKKQNDSWEVLNTITDVVFKVPLWELEPNSKMELEVIWKNIYGSLNPGEYRFVKYVSFKDDNKKLEDFPIGVSFVIE